MNATALDHVDTGDDLKDEPAKETESAAAKETTTAPSKEDAASATAAPAKADDKDKGVPLAALHEAREEARQLKAQIAELEKQPKLTAEDRELLADLKKQREEAKPKDPDFLEDPKGYIDTRLGKATAALEKLEKGQTEQVAAAEQERNFRQFMGTLQQHEAKFAAETPDYFDALNFMRAKRTEQLQTLYPEATDDQIKHVLAQEEIAGAAVALKGNRSPAEVAYRFAKTMGYAPKAKEEPKINGADKSAARTLGGSGGVGDAEDPSETEDRMPEFSAALRERFGVRKR